MPHEWREAAITVAGVPLTPAQSMTIRVALASFLTDLAEHGLGDDDHGRIMTQRYTQFGHEILALIHQEAR